MTYYDKFLEKLKTIQYLKSLQKLRNQHGAVFALTALLLPVLFGFMGLGYDVGNLYLHKARLQDTADATSLAGARGYVNELKKGSSTGVISLPTGSNDTLTKRNNAIAALKTNADNYIANNNPVFQDKLQNDNRTEKFYWIGKEVTSSDRNNSTEYFRVVLSEPVQLYFLPVIGIKSSADVSVYATTKLSDNEIVEGGSPNPQDTENKPVIITGGEFYEETNSTSVPALDFNNPNDGHYGERNYYNVSTVYAKKGSSIRSNQDANGNPIVYTNSDGVGAANIVEVDYRMEAFGEAIRQRFKEKQEAILTAEQKTLLSAFKTEKANWKKGYDEYITAYNNWTLSGNAAYQIPTTLSEAKEVYQNVKKYLDMVPDSVRWQGENSNEYKKAKQAWIDDGYPLTDNPDLFKKAIIDEGYYFPEPQEGNWGKLSSPPCNALGIVTRNGVKAPELLTYTSKYTSFDHEPNLYKDYGIDEYYMTFHGDISQLGSGLSTNDISTNPTNYGFSINDHSYLYITLEALSSASNNDTNVTINVDGFFTDNDIGITTDTPYYIFIDESIKQRVNVNVTANCNRPLVLCYLGPADVHYEISSNLTVRGIYYSPNAAQGTLINSKATNINFSGSIISNNLTIQSKGSTYKYDVDEIKKWQEASEGLPVTPNVGFTSSTNPGDNPAVVTEKITIPDHLRLVLASSITDDSHYNQARVSWQLIE